uniref:Uncharacterized protein n=1 Tax=Cuerna arida TaxID=1464854 RepID=A0A1B6EUV3_9HEMI
MTRWMFFLGFVIFVSLGQVSESQVVETDTLANVTGKVLEVLNELDKEYPQSPANKNCQNEIESMRTWFLKKEDHCRAKIGKPRDDCEANMVTIVEGAFPLLYLLGEYCEGGGRE